MQVQVIIMIPARVVVDRKSTITIFQHQPHPLKALKEIATLKNMSVDRHAGMAAMMVIGAVRVWDTVLIRYVQGQSVNNRILERKVKIIVF